MFDLHKFVMDTIAGMIGKEPEYKVRQYALAWLEKAVLTEEDLGAVEAGFSALAAQAPAEEAVTE